MINLSKINAYLFVKFTKSPLRAEKSQPCLACIPNWSLVKYTLNVHTYDLSNLFYQRSDITIGKYYP